MDTDASRVPPTARMTAPCAVRAVRAVFPRSRPGAGLSSDGARSRPGSGRWPARTAAVPAVTNAPAGAAARPGGSAAG
ncbi:hypothetical protein GCM10017559_41550 [Streptosporangium longisporum]|uniref:Uncharacterized protein n=1 Tax=Streptosporangium longisporum TaxID=46187 RepID=A0ABN3Y270_9ACTN